MNASQKSLLVLLSLFFNAIFCIQKVQFEAKTIDATAQQLIITIPLDTGEYIYADTISLSVNKPGITITPWKSSHEPINRYDQRFRTNKRVIEETPTLTAEIKRTNNDPISDASVRLSLSTNRSKTAVEYFFPLTAWLAPQSVSKVGQPDAKKIADQSKPAQTQENVTIAAPATIQSGKAAEENICKKACAVAPENKWSNYLTSVIGCTKSCWIQILLAFLLGLLMSLTPCIYPMIPITMGILQAHGTKSIGRNFLLALSYTIGIAATFAILGLAAALAGTLMGSFLTHPLVILLIIALLVYIALSLFGLYNMYMPRWLTNRQAGNSKVGGFITAFVFGAISGTIASPCLSPGIVFMLTLVAALKSVLIGFLLLFMFGIGLSMPLLLIGTFSSSIALLPQAGRWMEEIKYIFGFMMFAMCIYFLSGLIPWFLTLALFAILAFGAGIFYLMHSKQFMGTACRFLCLIGMIFIAGCVVIAAQSVKTYILPLENRTAIDWKTDYAQALALAKKENKKLFVCVHAPLCIACHELQDKLNSNERFIKAIKNWIAALIDLKDKSEATLKFVEQYKIIGAPNSILIDPANESVIKRWDYGMTNEQLDELISILESEKAQ